MNSVAQFFEHYAIERLYDDLATVYGQRHCVRPFNRGRHGKLSFGVLPGFRNYDLYYERYHSACRILMDLGAISDHDAVLDVGCGEGFFKFFFDALVPHRLKWHGIEVWNTRADFCRGIGYDQVDEVNLDVDPLPYNDRQYQLVLASHVIEHLKSPASAIREFARVLKPGGYLLVATPTKPPIVAQCVAQWHRSRNKATGQTQQAFTHRSLQQMILEATGWPSQAVVDKRGFRLVSARKKLPLENWKWFYRLSVFLGKHLTSLTPEVNILLRKP